MVITISVLGVLSGVALVMMQGAFGASQEALALSRVEMLNSALHTWSTANPRMVFSPQEGSTSDEMNVLRDLQFREPDSVKASIGSPYVTPQYNPEPSASDTDYRIRWNGRSYELLRPGQAGSGLRMVYDGSDLTEPFPFPPGFKTGSR